MATKITATRTPERPYVGQPCTVYGREARIIAVHPFGTIDVETVDGKCFRISGLAFS